MPEGDTIHRTANRLRPVLEGQPVVRFEAPRLAGDHPKSGDTIEAVQAVGKNLLVRFPRQLVLHTHMKMTGSWHIYRTQETWQEPAHLARVVIDVPGWVAVCFAAPTVRTWRDIAGQPNPLSHLGPDLCLPNVDIDLVVERVANIAQAGTSIAEVLLDQRVAAGIGNVYKSEALWACQASPFTPIELVEFLSTVSDCPPKLPEAAAWLDQIADVATFDPEIKRYVIPAPGAKSSSGVSSKSMDGSFEH